MNKEQIKDAQRKKFDEFLKIAKQKNFNQIMCLSAAGIMLTSADKWEETITAIIDLAQKCKDGDEFLELLLHDFEQYTFTID